MHTDAVWHLTDVDGDVVVCEREHRGNVSRVFIAKS